jgi:hypothetical protein
MTLIDIPTTRQPRERAVACHRCRRDTWHVTAICGPCRQPIEIQRTRAAIDEELVYAAQSISGSPNADYLHTQILERLDHAQARLGKRLAAALYTASLTDGDRLVQLVDALESADADYLAGRTFDHDDARCFSGPNGHCSICNEIAHGVRDEALIELRALLGDAVLADLAGAA